MQEVNARDGCEHGASTYHLGVVCARSRRDQSEEVGIPRGLICISDVFVLAESKIANGDCGDELVALLSGEHDEKRSRSSMSGAGGMMPRTSRQYRLKSSLSFVISLPE